MWNSVVYDEDKNGPCSRSKHSVTLLGNHLYVLAGRNGNVPLKDFWRFDLASNKWELLKPSGDCPPSLQEHTAVPFRDNIYVFGGELGFSAGNETPLWVYESKKNCWRKMRGQKGASVPKGRRGHTTLVHRGSALIYGGYCDLRGSSSEFWIFHFDTESWHLLMNAKSGPAARHKHSSVLHDDNMWIYGGMTDLQERSDLWRFDLTTKTWFAIKCKFSPGPLHSHAACKLPSSMLLFGGERNGQLINELWRFHFGTETWQRIRTDVISPQPISECCAVTVSELLLQNDAGNVKINARENCSSLARRDYHCFSEMNGGGGGIKSTNAGNCGYNQSNGGGGGSLYSSYYPSYGSRGGEGIMIPPRRQATTPNSCNLSFLKEISKISQMNLSRLTQNARCSYHALGSNESLHNGQVQVEIEAETSNDEFNRLVGRAKFGGSGRWSTGGSSSVLRDVSSLVNTPLTPSDAAKLVYLEGEQAPVLPTAVADEFSAVHQRLHPSQNRNRRSYPLTNTVRFANPLVTPEQPSPDITSDYASCENIHKLLSSNNRLNAMSCGGDRIKTPPSKDCSVISFSNPNYFTNTLPSAALACAATTTTAVGGGGGHQQMGYVEEKISRGDYVKLNSPADSLLEDSASLDKQYEMTELRPKPPKSLSLRCATGSGGGGGGGGSVDVPNDRRKKYRACSAGRHERQAVTSLCVFLIGGKDHCQITTFKRPISIWRLSLTEDIY